MRGTSLHCILILIHVLCSLFLTVNTFHERCLALLSYIGIYILIKTSDSIKNCVSVKLDVKLIHNFWGITFVLCLEYIKDLKMNIHLFSFFFSLNAAMPHVKEQIKLLWSEKMIKILFSDLLTYVEVEKEQAASKKEPSPSKSW